MCSVLLAQPRCPWEEGQGEQLDNSCVFHPGRSPCNVLSLFFLPFAVHGDSFRLVLAECTRGAPTCPGSSWMDPLSDPFVPLPSLFLSLINKIIRITAASDQLQLIMQPRPWAHYHIILGNILLGSSPASAVQWTCEVGHVLRWSWYVYYGPLLSWLHMLLKLSTRGSSVPSS